MRSPRNGVDPPPEGSAASRVRMVLVLILAVLGLCLWVAAWLMQGRARPRGFAIHGEPTYRAAAPIEPQPSSSLQARAWDVQRLWSPHVDWEPAVAADRSSSFVYQMTTRYYAPDCAGCPDPAVVFRRSPDGGATWEADRFLDETAVCCLHSEQSQVAISPKQVNSSSVPPFGCVD